MKQQYLQTGKIVSTHGVRGEVKLLPWADSPEFLLQFDTLWIGGRAYRVESSRVQKTCVLVKLAGIDTVEAASACAIRSSRSTAPTRSCRRAASLSRIFWVCRSTTAKRPSAG